MPIRKLQAKIKIAQKQLGLPDDEYRGILYAKCRVTSSKSLSDSQCLLILRHFKALGWVEKSKPKKYDNQKGDIYSASPGQKRLIEVLWHNIYRGSNETKHLNQFIFNHTHVSDIRFLDGEGAYKVIEALKAMQTRRSVTSDQ
jgi:phage gp16-like protein